MLLQNLQLEFAEAILNDTEEIEIIQPSNHLKIYRNNFFSNLSQTLQKTYPLITKLLGEEFFHTTVKEYILHYPSISGNLADYGEYFADFLTDYSPVENLSYLAEIAQFEWACHLVFFAANPPEFDIALLKNISQDQYEQLHFRLHPASQLMQCQYPILHIIELCNGITHENINLQLGGIKLLIIRRELEISLVTLTVGEYEFLSALKQNLPLGQALDTTMKVDADFKLNEKLPLWIKDKAIVGVAAE